MAGLSQVWPDLVVGACALAEFTPDGSARTEATPTGGEGWRRVSFF